MEAITRNQLYTHFNESINGVSTIRAYNQENRFAIQSDKLVDVNNSVQMTLLTSARYHVNKKVKVFKLTETFSGGLEFNSILLEV